jgi:hypothetical protein
VSTASAGWGVSGTSFVAIASVIRKRRWGKRREREKERKRERGEMLIASSEGFYCSTSDLVYAVLCMCVCVCVCVCVSDACIGSVLERAFGYLNQSAPRRHGSSTSLDGDPH